MRKTEIEKMEGANRYQRIGRRLVCENKRFDVFFDWIIAPDGSTVRDFLIVKPKITIENSIGGVCILPEVGGKIGLMCGWRHQISEEVWQAPAGFVEPDEQAVETALRELEEETSLSCNMQDIRSLGLYLPDAGLLEARVALFVAKNSHEKTYPAKQDREIGTGKIKYFSVPELRELLRTSYQIGGSTAVACYRYLETL